MTSQPQLSTPATAEDTEAALRATPVQDSGVGTTTDLIERELTATPPSEPAPPGWWPRLGRPARKPLLLGFLGSVVMAVGGLGAGGVLIHDPVLEGTPLVAWRFGHGYDLAVTVTYIGLALAVWAWVLLGRDVLARRAGGRAVLSSAVLWMLPMLVAPPLFSRDPYSYLADGAMALRGIDPYAAGPNVLTGPIPDNVHWFWQDTPAPYGPLFVALAKAVVSVTGENLIVGVILIRLAMLAGLVLFVAALPGLCRHLGGRMPVALWLAVANPVMVVLMIGGPHNDLLVVGCIAMGSLLVLNRRHAAGIALVTCAAAVKATAGIALPFLVLVWAARLSGTERARIVKAATAGIAAFLATFAVTSVVAGVGLGWIPAVLAPTNIVNWLSLPTGVGQLTYTVWSWMFGAGNMTVFISVARAIGVIIFLTVAVKQWLAARGGGPDAVRRGGVVLMVFVLLSPAVLPWYFTWGMAILAATTWSEKGMTRAIFYSIFLIIAAFPSGEVSLYAFGYLIIVMAGAAVAAKSLRSPDPLRLRSLWRTRRVPTAGG
ncbi:polyprenol phosphomannose-dependent alpha 1,6 mannosyltransferase MptB [Pseudonocardia acaciae]|uniref:polyprenol phosphomannose-dependent alpha 1,6 mannosyltransferase MptB n=1 Tax=Pseudonocardia acaciae TaxID=551276 RepID=UPI000A000904|nr:polyprenol phosphomannose-dependent alpha 1,6 mannosyltransferase MptB [Pseudonocardia acaciae]